MKISIASLLLIGVLLFLDVDESSAWWWRRRTKSSRCHGGKPYYFGTTNLWCMKKGKRAPSRGTLTLKHRWIYFDGYYFERLVKKEVYGRKADSSHRCKWVREGPPAGYSRLSVDCIKKCTKKYRGRYGGYNLLTNNCHHFANKISHVLCDYTTCPSWCN